MLDRIKASMPSLAPAEQRVAKLVLQDPRSFASLPVSELAERAHVSKPTVVRFCRSMGYDGLSDFKLKLAGTVSEGVPFIHRSVDADDKTSDVMVKLIDNTVAAFLKYRNDASHHAILPKALSCRGRTFAAMAQLDPQALVRHADRLHRAGRARRRSRRGCSAPVIVWRGRCGKFRRPSGVSPPARRCASRADGASPAGACGCASSGRATRRSSPGCGPATPASWSPAGSIPRRWSTWRPARPDQSSPVG